MSPLRELSQSRRVLSPRELWKATKQEQRLCEGTRKQKTTISAENIAHLADSIFSQTRPTWQERAVPLRSNGQARTHEEKNGSSRLSEVAACDLRVHAVYIRTASLASLACCASRIFNNLPVFNRPQWFDSPRLHAILSIL